jgi:hypothetical protein
MKRLLIFLVIFLPFIRGEAQTTTTSDRVVTKSLYLRDWWVDSVKRDTNFLGGNRSIPTAAAVYNFVAGRGAPGYTSVTSLPDSSGLIFHGPNGVKDTVVFEGETGGSGSSLPSMTGNGGKYLTTDGTDASWGTITGGGSVGTLQQVTDAGNTTTDTITVGALVSSGTIHLGNLATDPAGASNGDKYYNTTTHKERTYVNGAFRDVLTEGSIGYITGKIVTVDKDAANATDVRAGISKYNSFYPFKTIAAAATVMADGDVLVVAAGNYGADSLELTVDKEVAVYLDGVKMTGDIVMKGKIFVTNTTLNSHIYFHAMGADIASGNLIAGLDKGSSVINGRIEVSGSPGNNFLTIRHIGRITTPASGYGSGVTIIGNLGLYVIINGVSTIENLGTGNGRHIMEGGQLYASGIGKIACNSGGNQMFVCQVSLYDVNLVEYGGTEGICGGYNSLPVYMENVTFKATNSWFLFNSAYTGASFQATFRHCRFINTTAAGGWAFMIANDPGGAAQNKGLFLYDCHFQLNNSGGANRLIATKAGHELQTLHLINCLSNANSTTLYYSWDGSTLADPATNIVSGYVNNPAFIIKQSPQFN